MVVLRDGNDKTEIVLNGQILEKVETFKYVEGIFRSDGNHTEDVKMKVTRKVYKHWGK